MPESFGHLGYGIHFRLTKLADVDAGLKALMREAYELHAALPPGKVRVRTKRLQPTARGEIMKRRG